VERTHTHNTSNTVNRDLTAEQLTRPLHETNSKLSREKKLQKK